MCVDDCTLTLENLGMLHVTTICVSKVIFQAIFRVETFRKAAEGIDVQIRWTEGQLLPRCNTAVYKTRRTLQEIRLTADELFSWNSAIKQKNDLRRALTVIA